MLVSTSSDGTLRAFNPTDGTVLWTFVPESLGYAIRCWSGVTFSYKAAKPYIVYAVADGATEKNDSPLATTRVIAVDTSGALVFQSESLNGIAAGTPVTSSDGSNILVTHNVDALEGYLSIFSVSGASPTAPLAPIFSENYASQESGSNGTVAVTRPFSPIGYYHNPTAGWYDGGANNTNDHGWSSLRLSVPHGLDSALGVRSHGKPHRLSRHHGSCFDQRRSQHVLDCLQGHHGLLHWRSSLARTYFSRGRTGRATFDRAERPAPAYQAPRAQVTLSSDPVQPMVYGVGAAPQIWSMTYDYGSMSVGTTPDLVSSRLLLTQDEQYVIYATQATVSTDGGIYMVPAGNLDQTEWKVNVTGGVYGDIALNGRGTTVYAADILGQISAYQFGVNTAATPAPTAAPTMFGSPAPSDFPTPSVMEPSDEPSMNVPPLPTDPTAPTDPTVPTPSGPDIQPPIPPTTSTASTKMATLILGLASALLAFTL